MLIKLNWIKALKYGQVFRQSWRTPLTLVRWYSGLTFAVIEFKVETYFMATVLSVCFSECEQKHAGHVLHCKGEEPSTLLLKSHTLRSDSSEGDEGFL